MEEKYITKLLTFSDENLMGNVETISLTRKNVKELLNELHKNYVPISLIQKKKEELKNVLDIIKTGKNDFSKGQASALERIIKMLDKELLNERNNTNV